MEAFANARLGRHELLARIATGGMGEIFLARLEGAAGFEKLFVIKRILPHLAGDPRFRAMLIAEARIAANMSHANVCQVYELAESDGELYIVMEYLEGATLLALLRKRAIAQRPLDFGLIGGVVQQVSEGLHYAHELRSREGELLGIVHRDLTPSNIFLTESGVVKVHDFGVAKVNDAHNTESGAVKGKFGYMAPEQLIGGKVDRRADVFAFGVVIAEMITGRQLFQRKTDYLTYRAVMEQPLPDLRKHRPELSAELHDAVIRALARDPEQRLPTVRAVALAVGATIPRSWSQAEISEFVRSEFDAELRHHNIEISSVAGRGRAAPRTMPTISTPLSDPGDDYFTFETSVGGDEPAGSAAPAAPAVARPPARIGWMVGVAAVALGLGVALIRILRAPGERRPPPASVVSSPSPAAHDTAAYRDALRLHDRELASCAAGARSFAATATLMLASDGTARQITLTPGASSPIATCLGLVLAGTRFPPTPGGAQLSLSLRL